MNKQEFLDLYGRAWETRDADLAANLFTRDAHYHEDPLDQPIVGREAIRSYWKSATAQQRDIKFSSGPTYQDGHALIAEWTATYTHIPSRERRELRGVLIADFYGEEVRTFREYWHRRVLSR